MLSSLKKKEEKGRNQNAENVFQPIEREALIFPREGARRKRDLNGDSCRFRARADSRNRSCLFRRGSRCSLRHAFLTGSFPRREIRLTSRHRPMLPAVLASPTSQPLCPSPRAGLKQIFRRENNPFAYPRLDQAGPPVSLLTFSSEFPSRR